ncbi:glutamine-hydrolyzing carbamoyl-phosphate synthase small subunit [Dehalobacter sp. DCM]|uniref:glutamine-hydrolyzing carbamoyl-phosphate synthase small subunit n=1 Tax=Dehalobacter sp. DCM TaxID=2907827 RepID=UPI003081E109|nr:glutamine-hydrolyzing carbamoyl-phosphate synthase small subunit [Dehalobacter sp. DCM]
MAWLVLSDGKAFAGDPFGPWNASDKIIKGEVVFNTSMGGYQEMITDLSYAGQILTFTHPQIGNYGWHNEESEADKVLIKGILVRELSSGEGSLHADKSLEDFCCEHGIPGMKGLDTRALTRYIRNHGTIPGVMVEELSQGIDYWQKFAPKVIEPDTHWVYQATVTEEVVIPGSGPTIAVLDLGAKKNILRCLTKRGYQLHVFPAGTPARKILDIMPQGLVLTNGPGDPSGLPEIAGNMAQLIDKLPILGICMGHQIMAMAAGANTYKLPFGHRGGNHPVQNLNTGKVTMTSQNHGYAVTEESLNGTGFSVMFRNVNDGTVEGLRHDRFPVLTVQYHPEAAPGPEENNNIFDLFATMLE